MVQTHIYFKQAELVAQVRCVRYAKGDYFGTHKYNHNYNWSDILAIDNAELGAEVFTSVVNDAIDSFVPKRTPISM